MTDVSAESHPASAPLVTIGLPVFNGEAMIKRALGSLIDQNYPNLEIIISDNASTDATLKICRRVLRNRPNVRIIEQPINRGPHANFEAVLREAHGEFFMWAADDDVWRPTFVSTLVAELLEHPDACVAMCGIERRREDDTPFDIVRFVDELSPNGLPPSRLGPLAMSAKFNLFIYGLYRTEILRRGIAQFPRALGGDRMFVAHFALGYPFRYVDELLYLRTHRADHDRAYVAELAQRGAKLSQVLAFIRLIASTRALPLGRKLGLPYYACLYAGFVYRKEVAKFQYELLKLTKPSLRSRKRDSVLLTLLGILGAVAVGAGELGWGPHSWIGAGVFALSMSMLLLMVLQVRLSLAVKGEQDRMNLELQSARKKLRVLGEIVERDHEQLGLDSHRIRKLLAALYNGQTIEEGLTGAFDGIPPEMALASFEDRFGRLADDRFAPIGVAEDGPDDFASHLDGDHQDAEEHASRLAGG
jgi:glycosyltransferase involved in cell wall biosynthesis